MIGFPPVFAGAVQLTCTELAPDTPTTSVGAPGTAISEEGPEASPLADQLEAETMKYPSTPCGRSVMVQVRGAGVESQMPPFSSPTMHHAVAGTHESRGNVGSTTGEEPLESAFQYMSTS